VGAGRDLFERWRDRGVPTSASAAEVERVLEECLASYYRAGKGSHVFVVQHPWLVNIPRLRGGLVTIYLRKGTVPSEALKNLVFAIRCVDELRQRGWPKDRGVPTELGEALEREFG
jgi:hypothetical protein